VKILGKCGLNYNIARCFSFETALLSSVILDWYVFALHIDIRTRASQ